MEALTIETHTEGNRVSRADRGSAFDPRAKLDTDVMAVCVPVRTVRAVPHRGPLNDTTRAVPDGSSQMAGVSEALRAYVGVVGRVTGRD